MENTVSELEEMVGPQDIKEDIVDLTYGVGNRLKNIGLFFASPFIALGYVVALPVVGSYYFGKLGIEAYRSRKSE